MSVQFHQVIDSERLVALNTSHTEGVLLRDISIDEMHGIINEYISKRINIFWKDTLLRESITNSGLIQAFVYRSRSPIYISSAHLQKITGLNFRGKKMQSYLHSLPIETQRALADSHKPSSFLELKKIISRWQEVIAPDLNEILNKTGNTKTFINNIVDILINNNSPVRHPFRYFELLTILWEKGLFLFPIRVSTWETPVKWSTLTNEQYGGQRSSLIKSIYTLPPSTRSDPAQSQACTFFAATTVFSHEDLSISLIRDYEGIAYELIEEQNPRKKNEETYKTQRSRLRFVVNALLRHFNYTHPSHSIEITRPNNEGITNENRRVDGQFRWIGYSHPTLHVWGSMFHLYISSLKTARTHSQIDRLNLFGDFICTLSEPPTTPWEFIRNKHFYDASLQQRNTFLEYINKNNIPIKRKNDIIFTVRRFFDWLVDYLFSIKSPEAEKFKNPIFESDSISRNESLKKTHRDTLPPYIMRELRDTLTDNDFEFGKKFNNLTVNVYDKHTKNHVWVFDPILSICLYTIFDTPIRSHQGRWLDSGLLDEKVYEAKSNSYIPNPSKYAIRGRREGALRLEHDGLRADGWLSLWINTNKTAVYNSKSIGYSIPYTSNTLAQLLLMAMEWQKRYLDELKAPVSYIEYQNDVREAPRPADVKCPQVTPLFRDSRSAERIQPISYARLKRFYIQVLAEAQKRIEHKYGHRMTLVTDDGKGGLKWTVDLHSLRVSGITNLIEAGVPLEVVQQFVAGHATLVMTLHYLKYSPAKMRKFLEQAHERMQDDEDFVGSELFADSLEEFAPFLLGQEGAGIGAGYSALQDRTGIMIINSEGICPGTSCSTGGALESEALQKYLPVPGGQRCGLCRYWLTGPAHLLGQVAAVNNLAYFIRKKGQEVAKLNDQRLDAEDHDDKRKARELRDRVDLLNRELEIDINEWAARYRYAEKSLALMDAYLAKKVEVQGSGTQVPVPLLTPSSAEELKVTLEQAHEFALLDQITQMSEFTTGFQNREADLEKNTILSKMMVANGMEPFLLKLNEQQAHEAGKLLSALLLQRVRAHDLDEVLIGKKPLDAYPGLANTLKLLEKNATPEALSNSYGINKIASSLSDEEAKHCQDDDGEQEFG